VKKSDIDKLKKRGMVFVDDPKAKKSILKAFEAAAKVMQRAAKRRKKDIAEFKKLKYRF
jgi:hypothetical protein